MIDDYKYMRLFIYVLIYDCILYSYGLLVSFVFGGSGFIDIDTYLYGIPFKDDSEGVVSYSLGRIY